MKKVDRKHPIYAYPKTNKRFRKLKVEEGVISDTLLTKLMDVYQEVKKRK